MHTHTHTHMHTHVTKYLNSYLVASYVYAIASVYYVIVGVSIDKFNALTFYNAYL